MDALLCAGDLYEQDRFSPGTGDVLREAFSRLAPMPVFVAPGNHDWYGPDSLYRRVPWSSNVHVFSESRLEPAPISEQYTLWGAAHCVPANTPNFLENFHAPTQGLHLAVFHGSERGFFTSQVEEKVPHAPFREDEIQAAGLRHAFLGHYHRPKDTPWLTYAGSPQPLAFGEGEGGAVLVELDDGTVVNRRRIDVSTVSFHDVSVDVTKVLSMQEIRERTAAAVSGLKGVARVTLTGILGRRVDLKPDDLKTLNDELECMVVRSNGLALDYDFDTLSSESTVRGQFVRDVRGSNLNDDERERVLTVGLRAFDGWTDLEPI